MNSEILKTVKFIVNTDQVEKDMRKNYSNSNLNLESLKDSTIIVSEYKKEGANLQEMRGFDKAYTILQKNPKAKIFLYGFLPLEYAMKNHKKAIIVMNYSNVRYLRAPFTQEELIESVEGSKTDINQDHYSNAMQNLASQEMATILHGLNGVDNISNPVGDHEVKRITNALKLARTAFSALVEKSDTEVIDFLKESAANRPLVKEGQKLTGIFCDIEGTLFNDGKLNSNLLDLLKENDRSGRTVTLWSDGNLDELQALLNSCNITFPLVAKRDYAGAYVEQAIDDLDEVSFTALTKINTLFFSNIKNMKF